MIRSARAFLVFSLIAIIVVSPRSPIYAFEFAGLNGTAGDIVEGDPSSVDWPPEFMAELEALQASVIRQMEKYDSWMVDRTVSGKITELRGEEVIKNNYFVGNDWIIPKTNSCDDSDAYRVAVVSGLVDKAGRRTETRSSKGIFKTTTEVITIEYEFVASVSGNGWNCEGRSGEEFWTDDKNLFTGEPISKEESQASHGTDQGYINDYLDRTINVRYEPLDLSPSEGYKVDYGAGIFAPYLQEAKKFVKDNCICPEEEKKQ